MSDTTDRGYPYPQEDDPIAVHSDIEKLARAVSDDVQQLADDADGHFVLDEDNTATGSNQFDGETTFNEDVTINKGSGLHLFKGGGMLSDGYWDYRGNIKDGPNLVNKQYVDDADAELQQAIERLEGVTHRTEWVLKSIPAGDPVGAGEMTWRDPGGMGWSSLSQIRINHEDLGGRVHPMGTVQSGNLFLVEWADDQDVIQGSAVYIVGTIRSNTEWIDFDPSSMVHASGRPPAMHVDQVMKLVFTPADSGSGDYWTKAESDGRYLAKGTTTAIQRANGSTRPETDFILKSGSDTKFVLDNGGTTAKTNYVSRYTGTNATTKAKLIQADGDFVTAPSSGWTKVDATRTASGISKLGQLPTGTSTSPSLDVGQMYLNTNTGNITIRVS